MVLTQPPTPLPEHDKPWVFLAGSIEQDTAEKWQVRVMQALEPYNIHVLNPRRDDWDPTLEQRAHNPQFNAQVTWELDALEGSDLVLMYFDPNTKSPISLLELGMLSQWRLEHAHHLMVACPSQFWRRGNVEMVCGRYSIPLYFTLERMLEEAKRFLLTKQETAIE